MVQSPPAPGANPTLRGLKHQLGALFHLVDADASIHTGKLRQEKHEMT